MWKSLIFLTSVFLLIHFFGCYKQKSPKFKRTWNKYLAFIAENFACLQKYTLANFLQEKKDWESCQLSPFSHFCDWFCTERSRTLSSKGLASHPEKLVVVFKVYFSKMTQMLNLFHVVFTGNLWVPLCQIYIHIEPLLWGQTGWPIFYLQLHKWLFAQT